MLTMLTALLVTAGPRDAAAKDDEKLSQLVQLLDSSAEAVKAELQRRLDEGAYRVIPHPGFRKLWAQYIRQAEVRTSRDG
jgi:hypothetical protein